MSVESSGRLIESEFIDSWSVAREEDVMVGIFLI